MVTLAAAATLLAQAGRGGTKGKAADRPEAAKAKADAGDKPGKPETAQGQPAQGAQEKEAGEGAGGAYLKKEPNPRPRLLDTVSSDQRHRLIDEKQAKKERSEQGLPTETIPDRDCPQGLALRVRITNIVPPEPSDVVYRHGMLGGTAIKGTLATQLPVGQWTQAKELSEILLGDEGGSSGKGKAKVPGDMFLKILCGSKIRRNGTGGSTDVEMECEVSYKGQVLRTFKEWGPDGGLLGISIPFGKLKGKQPNESPEFIQGICGLLEYAKNREAFLKSFPWADRPAPQRYSIISSLAGYGTGHGSSGTMTTNPQVIATEMQCMHLLGINGLRSQLMEKMGEDANPATQNKSDEAEAPAAEPKLPKAITDMFLRGRLCQMTGYPVPKPRNPKDTTYTVQEICCPFHPTVPAITRENIERTLPRVLAMPVQEVWALTDDEVNPVFTKSPLRLDHLPGCPYCAAAFQAWLKGKGLSPEDFGKKDWGEVRPVNPMKFARAAWKDDPRTALLVYQSACFVT
jgi:hypothetical protein